MFKKSVFTILFMIFSLGSFNTFTMKNEEYENLFILGENQQLGTDYNRAMLAVELEKALLEEINEWKGLDNVPFERLEGMRKQLWRPRNETSHAKSLFEMIDNKIIERRGKGEDKDKDIILTRMYKSKPEQKKEEKPVVEKPVSPKKPEAIKPVTQKFEPMARRSRIESIPKEFKGKRKSITELPSYMKKPEVKPVVEKQELKPEPKKVEYRNSNIRKALRVIGEEREKKRSAKQMEQIIRGELEELNRNASEINPVEFDKVITELMGEIDNLTKAQEKEKQPVKKPVSQEEVVLQAIEDIQKQLGKNNANLSKLPVLTLTEIGQKLEVLKNIPGAQELLNAVKSEIGNIKRQNELKSENLKTKKRTCYVVYASQDQFLPKFFSTLKQKNLTLEKEGQETEIIQGVDLENNFVVIPLGCIDDLNENLIKKLGQTDLLLFLFPAATGKIIIRNDREQKLQMLANKTNNVVVISVHLGVKIREVPFVGSLDPINIEEKDTPIIPDPSNTNNQRSDVRTAHVAFYENKWHNVTNNKDLVKQFLKYLQEIIAGKKH